MKIGLKCGGSDGLSGITANPLVGMFSDYIIGCGGSALLTEVPEMFGAEYALMQRAKDEKVFQKTVHLINDFKDYFIRNGQTVYENPSPGNKVGGISTLEDKALGCTQKSGAACVSGVLDYGEKPTQDGLHLLNGPGNDMVALTNLGACGCQLVLFTTGRGTPLGGFIPTIKISSNDFLAQGKPDWVDFNAAECLICGYKKTLKKLINFVEQVVNGAKTKNEKNGSKDIAIFKTGVTL